MKNLTSRIFTLLIILVLVLGGLASIPQTAQQNLTPSPTTVSIPTVVFPVVPEGGTPVNSDYTYFHPSGVISIPHLLGWDLSAGSEETQAPTDATKLTRVGSTFINSAALSVVHVFAERNAERKATKLEDLNGYYDKDNLNGAWENFKGGWKELNRTTAGDSFIINFELNLDGNTYLGRQISRFNNEWLMVMRIVSPNNNPALLDSLQSAIAPKYQFWTQALSVPLTWATIADYASGYVIRFPPDWRLLDGAVGKPFTVAGKLGTNDVTLSTRTEPNKSIKSEDDARSYVQAAVKNATLLTVKAANVNDVSGFVVSYSAPDADGNKRSAVTTLLNGTNGTLYVATLQSSALGQDLLDSANSAIPIEFTQIRNSFFLLPTAQLVPTLTPSASPSPLPTAVIPPTVTPTLSNTTAPTNTLAPTNTSAPTNTVAPTVAETSAATP
jgi:hypothetical protein